MIVSVLRRALCGSIVLSLVLGTFAFAQRNASALRNTASRVGTGLYRGQRVTFRIVKGKMIFEGDIALEHVDQKLPGKNFHPSGTLDYLQYRWPKVGSVYQIPYIIDPASGDATNIGSAVSSYNATFSGIIQWVPQTTETDYIDFDLDPNDTSGVGNSYIGRVTGKQLIWGSGSCTVATLLHEMGHATGLWHEQSRPDRNNYVTVENSNIISVVEYASAPQFDDMQTPTLYDWSSLMHYGAWAFTRNGNPTLESIPAGMPLSNNAGYSSSDIDGIKRLYGAAPTSVTVATNPAGLQVIVDGVTVTTPQSFNWPLFSTHTLSVPSTAQSQAGLIQGTTTATTFYYTYGRWNDNGAVSHSITVLPGNGELATPAASPAVTVYTASFIELVPYSALPYPGGTGTITPSPAPQSYSGLTGVYYTARQPVTLTANPDAAHNFYQFINSPYWVPGGLSVNPKAFLVPDTGNPVNMTAYFTPTLSPTYTIDSNPDGSNFYVKIDNGTYWPAPISFSPYYNSAWSAGSSHSIAVDPTQWPWTGNSRYQYGSWSDGGAQSHNVTLPSTSTTYTATLVPQYYLSDYANEGCAGTVGVTPISPTGDGFYPGGTPLTFSETPNTGWTFTEWQNDLTGTNTSENLTMNDELLVTADFSTTATPLTLTSISPSAAIQGGGNFTLTLNGTGFTTGTLVFVNNVFRADKFVNANQMTVAMTTADLATPGGFQIFVENFPTGASCAAYTALPFNVASGPIVTPSPLSLLFSPQLVGTTSLAKTVTLKNTSAATVSVNSITVTGDYAITSNTCGSSIASGATCTVKVTFTPVVSGAIAGSLAISDSAPDSPQTVAISGTGNLPLSFTPTTLAFGTVAVGTTSAAKTVSVTNNQSSTLSYSFSASGNYAISGTGTTCTGSLASKAKCNIAVTFTPTAAGVVNGTLSITDSTSFSPQLVTLSGTGSGGSTPPLSFIPATLTFTSQAVGTVSAPKSVAVKNVSTSSVTLSGFSGAGFFAAASGGTAPCSPGIVLPAGTACTITVTFSPAFGASGSISGAVVVSDNASVGQQILDVKGTSALPISFTPTSLTFAAQTVATASAAQTVTLTNNLATSLSPVIVGSGEFTAVPGGTTPCTGTLGAHAKCTITVTFTPSAIGTRASAVTITDSANPGVQTMNVTGTGQ